MRARSFRPMFDRLDTRLVLDASGASMVSGANLGASVLSVLGNNGSSGQQNLVDIVDWYLPGTPPPVVSDPTAIEVPLELLATQ